MTGRRRQFFIDDQVQGALLLRVISYWLFCLLTVITALVAWSLVAGPPRPPHLLFCELLARFGPALAAALLVLPLVIVDFIQASNRFAAPVYRLRRGLRRLADGQPAAPLVFRGDDFWSGLADDFNRLAARQQGGAQSSRKGEPTTAAAPRPGISD